MNDSVWKRNFINKIAGQIKEHKENGFQVFGVALGNKLYNRYCREIGFEPDNILGYKIYAIDLKKHPDDNTAIAIVAEYIN